MTVRGFFYQEVKAHFRIDQCNRIFQISSHTECNKFVTQ